jgi:hypothetical protein
MVSAHILVGRLGKRKKVDCVPIVDGLVAHTSPNKGGTSAAINITHISSGMAVLQRIPGNLMSRIIPMLSALDWTLPADIIAVSPAHFDLVEDACVYIRKKSKKQETRLAKDLDGKRQPASGSIWGYRRDVITPQFLVEAKTTEADRCRITDRDLEYLRTQSYEKGKTPVYSVELGKRPDVVVLPTNDITIEIPRGDNWRTFDRVAAKGFTITEPLADFVNDGGRRIHNYRIRDVS